METPLLDAVRLGVRKRMCLLHSSGVLPAWLLLHAAQWGQTSSMESSKSSISMSTMRSSSRAIVRRATARSAMRIDVRTDVRVRRDDALQA